PSRNHFYNCRMELPLGPLHDALLLNNQVAGQTDWSQVAVQVLNNKTTVLIPGASTHGPQLLVTSTEAEKK
ncbi:MAG: hypothetical protein WCI73_20140, partial [Phycisphaerae bacterium]